MLFRILLSFFFFWYFFALHTNGKRYQEGSHPCYFQCQGVYEYHNLNVVAPKVSLTKVPFVAIFWPDMNSKMGVVIYMYLNIPLIILTLNIYGFMGLSPIFGMFNLTQRKEEVWPGGTQPMLLPE